MPANPLRGLYELRRRELEAERAGDDGLSRRQILQRGAVLGAGAVVGPAVLSACGNSDSGSSTSAGGGGGTSDELNILTWEGYHQEPWLADYKGQSGVTVNVTNVGSPAEMFAKVKANPEQYDIIYNTSGWFDQYVSSDLIVPIDESQVPNVKQISDAFPWRDATSVDGTNYGILYTWGDQPLGWNTDDIPGNYNVDSYLGDTGVPDDWNILWDPQFAGQVTIFDDPTSVEPMIPLALGFPDPYNLDEKQFAEFQQKLNDLRPQVRKLTSGFDDQANTFITGEAIIGYVNHTLVVVEANKRGIPIEANHTVSQGVPAWSDNATLTKAGEAKSATAYEFINEQISLPWQARLVKATGNTGTMSYEQAKSEGLGDKDLAVTLIPLTREGDAFFEKMVFFKAVEDLDRRIEVWDEFKLGIGT
jgi:spermidine/putrescine-binding protein